MTESYKHYTVLQCIWKPCRDHSYRRPMCTRAILAILAAILDLVSRWPPNHNFQTRNGFVALKVVGLEVLHKSLSYIGQNLGILQIQDGRRTSSWITKNPTQIMIGNQLSWKKKRKNQLSRFCFPFQSLMLLDYDNEKNVALNYCKSIEWAKFMHFHSRKCIWKCRLRNSFHFVSASMC